MDTKTEERIAREKAMVDAMKNAKSNMEAALRRIETLELALRRASNSIARFKEFVPKSAYFYGGQKTLHDEMNAEIANATAALGAGHE